MRTQEVPPKPEPPSAPVVTAVEAIPTPDHPLELPTATPIRPATAPETPAGAPSEKSAQQEPQSQPEPTTQETAEEPEKKGLPAAEINIKSKHLPLAVFRRGASLFIVIAGSNLPRDLPALVGSALAGNPEVSIVPTEKDTARVIRINLTGEAGRMVVPLIQSTDNGWRVAFNGEETQQVEQIPLVLQRDYALGARLMIAAAGSIPVIFSDPVIGDMLCAVPVEETARGFLRALHLPQVQILPSVQGAAIVLRADGLQIVTTPDAIEVSMVGRGLELAEVSVLEQAARDTENGGDGEGGDAFQQLSFLPLLDFAKYGDPAGVEFTAQRQRFLAEIASAKEDDVRAAAQSKLARFYFINGMPTEAAAVWSLAARNDPKLADSPEYSLFQIAADFSSGNNGEAKKRLNTLEKSADSVLWQALADAKERKWAEALEGFRAVQKRVYDYPDPYITRFQNAFIEAALQMSDLDTASSVLASMITRQRSQNKRKSIPPASDYLTGLLAWQQNHVDDARAHFGAAAKSWDHLWRVRAELALIDADLRDETIPPDEALRRLERLRFAWRGDALEYDMLYQLGGLYARVGDYPAAFESYARLARMFPDDPRSATLPDEQQALFSRIFQGEDRDKVPAFSQLALWDRYPNFRPTQVDVLTEVEMYLAQRAADIELRDRAVNFYRDVLSRMTDPVEKARLGTKSAGMLLLDSNADDAITMLNETAPDIASGQPDPLPAQLRDERRMLRARALSVSGKPEEALSLLSNDYTDPAMRLRGDITWKAKRWGEAAAVFGVLLGSPPEAGKMLTNEQRQIVVNRAVALALDGDTYGLAEMRDLYTPAMAGTPENALFQVLTRPESAGGLASRSTVLNDVAEVDLFKQFLDRYRSTDSSIDTAAGTGTNNSGETGNNQSSAASPH